MRVYLLVEQLKPKGAGLALFISFTVIFNTFIQFPVNWGQLKPADADLALFIIFTVYIYTYFDTVPPGPLAWQLAWPQSDSAQSVPGPPLLL